MKTDFQKIGITQLRYIDTSRHFKNSDRILDVLFWYPVDSKEKTEKIEYGAWKMHDAARNAPCSLAKGKLPLILFSHGYSGYPQANSWFAERLAQNGFIVASVRHWGNASPDLIPELSAKAWNRPKDLSFVLDKILKDPKWKNCIDENRIGAAGYSQGGLACLWVGGLTGNLTRSILHEQITVIDDPNVLKNFTEEDFKDANRSYKDERIKAAFAMAPALDDRNLMFKGDGLSKIKIPVYIVVGECEDESVIEEYAKPFAKNIPNCMLNILPGKVTHWTLLNEGAEGKENEPFFNLTKDDPSISRKNIHDKIASLAVEFFNRNLNQCKG